MQRRKISIMAGMTIWISMIITGCGLLEKEEEVKNLITLPAYDAASVECGQVKRGDVENVETMFLKLTTAQQHELSFQVSGIAYEKVYVKEGDRVTRNQLLAELDTEEIKAELLSLETQMKETELEIEHTENLLKEVRERKDYNVKKKDANQDEISRYSLKLNELANDMLSLKNSYKEQQEKISKRQIYADMDGVVSKVEKYIQGAVSNEKQAFITLQSAEQTFEGETKADNNLKAGDRVEILINEEAYQGVLLTVEREEGVTCVNVGPEDGVVLPEESSYAELVWSGKKAENVLYVPKEAIVTIREAEYVYCRDREGFFEPVMVKTGIQNSKYVQIIEGVEENDQVMLY